MNTSRKGRTAEQKLVRELRALGYIAARSAASKSDIDVWAVHPGRKIVRLFQLKTGKSATDALKAREARRLSELIPAGEYLLKTEVR